MTDLRSPRRGDAPAVEAGHLVSVPALVAALRRRWRLWVCGALLGTVAAVAFSWAVPPEHTATTTLLMEHPAGSNKARTILTDAQLVESRIVAQGAVESLDLRMSAAQLVDQYRPTVLSDDLLQIRVSGPSDREAVRRVEAVAVSFLEFRRDEIQRQSAVALKNLEERQRQLTAELLTVTDGINARTKAQEEAELRTLGELLVRRASLNDKLGGVNQRIDTATFETESINEKTRVIDPGGPDERSPVKAAASNVLVAVILGLLATTGWIVLQEVTTDRLRRREDVARALNAPIAASIEALHGPMWLQRRRFRKLLENPSPSVTGAIEHVQGVLDRSGPGQCSLVLVSVESDVTAALAVAATTLRLMREERSVLLVDLTQRNILARLTNVRPEEPDRLPLVGSASALWVSFPPHQRPRLEGMQGGPDHDQMVFAEVDVVLALATIDPAIGAYNLTEVSSTAVVVATAGRSTETRLVSVAQMSEAAGLRLHSTILVGADANDESVAPLTRRAQTRASMTPRVEISR